MSSGQVVVSDVDALCLHVMGNSLEDVFGLFRLDNPSDVPDLGLLLDQHQTLQVLDQWSQSWVTFKVRVGWAVFGHYQIVPEMGFHEVGQGGDHDGVALVVHGEAVEHSSQVFPYFDRLMLLLLSVESPVGGQNKQKVPEVAGEVLMTQVLGKFVVEVGPHRDVNLRPEVHEEVVQELHPTRPQAHVEAFVGLLVFDGDVVGGKVDACLTGVVEVEEDVVELENDQKLLSLLHLAYYYAWMYVSKSHLASLNCLSFILNPLKNQLIKQAIM